MGEKFDVKKNFATKTKRKCQMLRRDPKKRESGQRDLNPRPRAWEARTLPLSYARFFF